jgi:DNA-binding transcriptional regulator LsrR (DeoR family)
MRSRGGIGRRFEIACLSLADIETVNSSGARLKTASFRSPCYFRRDFLSPMTSPQYGTRRRYAKERRPPEENKSHLPAQDTFLVAYIDVAPPTAVQLSAICSNGTPVANPYDLMMRVSHHYYRSHLSMAEIGNRLGISRHRVGRLLKAAVATGVVNIEIRVPTGENVELRKALEKAFKLKAALILDVPPDVSPDQIKQMTCRAAAVPFLRDRLSAHRTIGVGWGSTTFELINALEPFDLSNAKVVQITGGNKKLSMQFDCHEVTRRLAQKLHVQPILLHAPGIVDNRRTRELLMRDSNIRDTFKYFGELDLAIVGVGAIRPAIQSMLIKSGYISTTELKSLKRAGAVGDVFSYFIDDDGEVVRTGLYDRLITIGLADIRRIPTRLGVAAGATKARALAAAMRGGFINTLIADSSLARAVLALRPKAGKVHAAPKTRIVSAGRESKVKNLRRTCD